MQKLMFLLCLLAVGLVGCGGKAEVPLVIAEGVLKDADGTPMEGVRVTFMPDVREGNTGPTSIGYTEADGSFTLRTFDNTGEGVVAGKHRVTLFDTTMERTAQGEEDAPERIPSKYRTENGALLVEVAAGEKIELQIPKED